MRKKLARDPRFDGLSGEVDLDQSTIHKRYEFVYEETLPKERASLKKALKASVDDDER